MIKKCTHLLTRREQEESVESSFYFSNSSESRNFNEDDDRTMLPTLTHTPHREGRERGEEMVVSHGKNPENVLTKRNFPYIYFFSATTTGR